MPWPKLGHKETSKDDKNKERIDSRLKKRHQNTFHVRCSIRPRPDRQKATRSYCEEELLGLLGAIVRPSEILKHERMWRARIKTSHKAIIKAVRKYHGLSEENQKQIKNPAAWMTKQYRLFGGRSVAKTA